MSDHDRERAPEPKSDTSTTRYRGRVIPDPPPSLPAARRRALRNGPDRAVIEITIRTTTPILGGGVATRQPDTVDILRSASIRGHLRFWWRALEGHRYPTLTELYAAETRLWGKAADEDGFGRSPVEIVVETLNLPELDRGTRNVTSANTYALWPALVPAGDEAPRRGAGVRIRLRIAVPQADRNVVEAALRVWVLFGGYGGRTRRGVGSLTLPADQNALPDAGRIYLDDEEDDEPEQKGSLERLHRELTRIFSRDVFAPSGATARPFPLLAGATLLVAFQDHGPQRGRPFANATDAWHAALRWMRDFRQGVGTARASGHGSPGRSFWPEPDKLRHLDHKHAPHHPPAYNAVPAWPRAGFGLPIVGRFRVDGPRKGDPPPFELNWEHNGKAQERMASPMILKALPVRGGFLACALWLNRDHPNGDVVLVRGSGPARAPVPGSAAPFSRLIAPGDVSRFPPLTGAASLRDAFMSWVAAKPNVRRVTP
jgi:CRISPR-associated protein Cmr1